MAEKNIAALVPMRHHSQRVPGKNYRPLLGKPLFYYILNTLSKVPGIQTIAVDTDSPVISEMIAKDYPKVQIINRPKELQADDVPMNEILMYDTAQVPASFYFQTHSTNPLLSSETVTAALAKFMALFPAYDSMFSVTRIQSRLWDSLARPINHDPAILLQTQNLPPVYEENSSFYLFTRDTLSKRRTRIGERPFLYEMNKTEAWDIDDEEDFKIAEVLLKSR